MTNRQFDQILSEQDSGLDSLHSVIVRSRITAQNIESEVGVQNDIIDNLGMIRFFLLSFRLDNIPMWSGCTTNALVIF